MSYFSYSRVEKYAQCHYAYYCRYVAENPMLIDQEITASSALLLGKMFHTAIEHDSIMPAIQEYMDNFFVMSDDHVNEIIKLEELFPKIMEALNSKFKNFIHELKVEKDGYLGFIDLICEDKETGEKCIVDYKYSNNVDAYLSAKQLHVYNYYMGEGYKLYYLFIPKTMIRQKKTESIMEFRNRLIEHLLRLEVNLVEVIYDKEKVEEFMQYVSRMQLHIGEYEKIPNKFCGWCDVVSCSEKKI